MAVARAALRGHGEALRHVLQHSAGMRVQRGGLRDGIAGLERRGALAEQRIVVLVVGGGDDQQVVLKSELDADVPGAGRGESGVDGRGETVRGGGRGGQDGSHGRGGESESGTSEGTGHARTLLAGGERPTAAGRTGGGRIPTTAAAPPVIG
ncbi:hypothetical protein AMETH_2317 [Amycolatopsis methanolica 239]|uniref:Uncharacterized protein n=2 Tax=Amycolatopsis methanolica TaxID=1814 RepID=A0A076MP16_AMYME|nr:hypothetical protein AMETH_2317 [Amycolatopsis methanolica 239]